MIRLQNLNENQIVLSNILNIMRHPLRNISTIPRMIIERSRRSLSCIYTNSRISSCEKVPFVASSMPMDFAHSARIHGYDCGGKFVGDGEGFWIEDFDGSARGGVG